MMIQSDCIRLYIWRPIADREGSKGHAALEVFTNNVSSYMSLRLQQDPNREGKKIYYYPLTRQIDEFFENREADVSYDLLSLNVKKIEEVFLRLKINPKESESSIWGILQKPGCYPRTPIGFVAYLLSKGGAMTLYSRKEIVTINKTLKSITSSALLFSVSNWICAYQFKLIINSLIKCPTLLSGPLPGNSFVHENLRYNIHAMHSINDLEVAIEARKMFEKLFIVSVSIVYVCVPMLAALNRFTQSKFKKIEDIEKLAKKSVKKEEKMRVREWDNMIRGNDSNNLSLKYMAYSIFALTTIKTIVLGVKSSKQ
jgi:hypothetical protein